MKDLIGMIILLFGLFACDNNDPGEPIEWTLFVQFETAEGGDLFKTYQEYDINKLSLRINDDIKSASDWDMYISNDRYHTSLIAGLANSESYFDYGNGDIDTLTIKWVPASLELNKFWSNQEQIEKFSVFVNGELVKEFDFVANPNLIHELVRRNNLAIFTKTPEEFDPIVIVIPKDPDWDELE